MTSSLVVYRPRNMPSLGSDQLYLQQELQAISNATQGLTQAVDTNTANIATHTASIAAHEAAWTAYTPVVTGTGGAAGTATGRYKQIGKTVHLQLTATVTVAGSFISMSLPSGMSAKVAYPSMFLVGRENAAVGFSLVGLVGYPTVTQVTPWRYDGATFGTLGWRADMSGTIEIA